MKQVDPARLMLAGAAALFLGAAATSIVSAQPPTQPLATKAGGYKNVKIFPLDTKRDSFISAMQFFSKSLGVKCTHCHVGEDGKRETMDFPSDAKREKLVARQMMLMVKRLNEDEFKVSDVRENKVSCYTCHRGAVKPLTAPAPVEPPTAS